MKQHFGYAFSDDEDNASFAGTPYFQSALFRYLDLEAPTIERKKEFGNLALLFYELISHDVFSHDSYLCQLISRGDINQPLGILILFDST